MPYAYHLKFGIKIVKLQTVVDEGLDEKIFIRYHVLTFDNRRIQVDTREIQNKNDVSWDESASFECHTSFDQIELVEKSNHITFELRSRRSKQGFGGIMAAKSRLLGRGEISWGNLVRSEQMKLKKWVNLSAKGLKLEEFKLPNLLVQMEVQLTREVGLNGKKKCRLTKDCDCIGCEVDIFHVETVVD